jgi:hypothetical protein
MTGLQITSKALAGLSVVTGVCGTYLMYKYSATLGQFTPYWSHELIAEVKAQNAKRLKGQRIGFAFLIAGIILAGASALIG